MGYAYLDTETTGLVAGYHEIWEVGLILDTVEVRNEVHPEFVRDKFEVGQPGPENGRTVTYVGPPRAYGSGEGFEVTTTAEVQQRWQWFIQPEHLERADPYALNIGRWHDRSPHAATQRKSTGLAPEVEARRYFDGEFPNIQSLSYAEFARQFTALTKDQHLVGAVVSFDEERLRLLLKARGQLPLWHYHSIDVEPLAIGYLQGVLDQASYTGDAHPVVGSHPEDGGFDPKTLPWKSYELSKTCGVEPPTDDEQHTALGDADWARRLHRKIMGFD